MSYLGDAVQANLSSPARGGEYLRLMWKVQLNLLPFMGPILSKVRSKLNEMRDDPAGLFVAVAGPNVLEEGATILGYGSGYITASVKLSARATGQSIGNVLAPVNCINVVLSKAVAPVWQWFSCTVEMERVWRISHLYDAGEVATTAAGEDRGPFAGLDLLAGFTKALTPILFLGAGAVALAYLAPFLPRPRRR